MELMEKLSAAIIKGNVEEIEELTQEALDEGKPARAIIDEGLLPGMDYVGVQFRDGTMYIPEVMMTAHAMQSSMTILKPHLSLNDKNMMGSVVIGTVKGDMHSIGKNIVAMMLVGAGFDVQDLGIDVAPETFVESVKENNPNIVGMSALLTTTMLEIQETISALVEAGIRDQVKIIVGGAPVTADFGKEIGADGYASNAMEAVELAKSLFND